jgi:hypothetical protein
MNSITHIDAVVATVVKPAPQTVKTWVVRRQAPDGSLYFEETVDGWADLAFLYDPDIVDVLEVVTLVGNGRIVTAQSIIDAISRQIAENMTWHGLDEPAQVYPDFAIDAVAEEAHRRKVEHFA